jgi:tetratricopeptide (TPR) repeat protein
MYAATTFIILELVDIVAPSLGLPDWTLNLVIVLLCIGFPIAVIFSWIFDITPEGLKKTEPVQETRKEESPPVPAKRKLKPSDVIITVLIVIVVIMAYPKLFKQDKFKGIRDPDGKISIAVMPFENLSGDTLYNIWQGGFQNLLINSLSNSKEISVRQPEIMFNILSGTGNINYASINPSIAGEIALKLETNTFILGNIMKAGSKIRIGAQLRDATTREIYRSYEIDVDTEDQIFILVDSLSNLIKNYLEIKVLEKDFAQDAPIYHSTNSAEAYRHYLKGISAFANSNYPSAIESLTKALEIDSSFVVAIVWLCVAYSNIAQYEEALKWYDKALHYRDEVPVLLRLRIDWRKASFDKLPQEEIKCVKQFLEVDDQSFTIWFLLGYIYSDLELYEKALEPLEKAYELSIRWEGFTAKWQWLYITLGEVYHKTGNHKKEKEIYEHGLSILPDNPNIIYRQAICALSQGDSTKANQFIAQFKSLRKEESGWSEPRVFSNLGSIYSEAKVFDKAEKYYRNAFNLDPQNSDIMNDLAWFLIVHDINVNEGIELINRALEISPENYNFLNTKGWGLYKQGRYEEALKVLNDSWDLRPIYNHTGYLHIQEVKKALASQNN